MLLIPISQIDLGMALGLGESEKNSKIKRKAVPPSVSKEHLRKGLLLS